ncbi:putative solute:sodium symporter small subunit [Giesbergeria anulus]|uniref:Putative solute:sodium symporter small subunit n=1 Tax=Giesbergeria anulus TaxID=180197 RepID=A0A1H9SIL3_9BURK|nr:putative solute:sodium symporter small subunit [Giesbergeria anulus]
MVTRIHAVTPASGAPPALPPVVLPKPDPRRLLLQAVLLLLWVLAAFGVGFFARHLQTIEVFGWPLGYWLASQGVVLVFLAIVLVYAVVMRYIDRHPLPAAAAPPSVREQPPHG